MFVKNLARFNAARMGKTTVARGEFLFAGLNSFEPGQEHAPHAHEGQDKLYVVLEGSCLVQVGVQEERLSVGDAAFALSGVLHSIGNPGPQRLVVLAILAPRASSHPRRPSEALAITRVNVSAPKKGRLPGQLPKCAVNCPECWYHVDGSSSVARLLGSSSQPGKARQPLSE